MNKKKRKISIIVMLALLLTGCYSGEERVQMKKYEEQGKENAETYIFQKYGFEPEILECRCEKARVVAVPDFSPPPTGMVKILAEHEGTEFGIYISGEEEYTESAKGVEKLAYDNYQFEDIQKDYKELMDECTGVSSQSVYLAYGCGEETDMAKGGLGLIHEYYDGSNLRQILEERGYQTQISYVDQDLSEISYSGLVEKLGEADYLFLSYRDEESYEASERRDSYMNQHAGYHVGLEEDCIFLTEYRRLNKEQDDYIKLTFSEDKGIIFVTKDGKEVSLKEAEIDISEHGTGEQYEYIPVLGTYEIVTKAGEVYVYIPTDILSETPGDGEEYMFFSEHIYRGKEVKRNLSFYQDSKESYIQIMKEEDVESMKFMFTIKGSIKK